MVRERKCILCYIVYSSKKEMDEHMRSMLHHRELENLRGRDCSHECRVCQVTVVGLSTYAKHISSQLHKDNVDAQENEEEKEEAEEEYFDKELIQLLNQRKEQIRQEEASSSSKEQETDRYQQRRGERLLFQDMGPQGWRHCDQSNRDWPCSNNPRQDNFVQSSQNLNPKRHISSTRGRAGWHLNGPPNHRLMHGNIGGSWHSNAGGPTNWHHRGTGRNFHWHKEENDFLPIPYSRKGIMNWQHNSYNGSQWKIGGSVDAFRKGRIRPFMQCDSTLETDPGWSKKNGMPNKFSTDRFTWKQVKHAVKNTGTPPSLNLVTDSSKKTEDFTSDKLPEDQLFAFNISAKPDKSTKTVPSLSPGKNNSPSRDKTHRWAPYPSQKGTENEQSLLSDPSPQNIEPKKKDSKTDKDENLDNLKMREDNDMPTSSDNPSNENKADQSEPKRTRMPSLKSPLRSIPDVKSSTLKRDQRNPLKGVKMLFPMSAGERQNRLSALNLETVRSNSYISKLRSASRNLKTNQEIQESCQIEPVETLGEVLRKAKEMLQNSQSLQSPYFDPMKDVSVNEKTIVSKESTKINSPLDDSLEDVSEGDLSENGTKIQNTSGSDSNYACDPNSDRTAEDVQSTKSLEQAALNPTSGTLPMEASSEAVDVSEPLEEEHNGITTLFQDEQEDEHFEPALDFDIQKDANHSSSQFLPELSKLGLPASLQRDLTRHIGSRSKTGTNPPEPNLNIARRIRNVSGHRKSETDKDSGLKPTLRQILNASRRNINWEQVMQQVNKKRLEQGKGLPRFGIEMVAQVQSEQEGLDFDEETDLNIEDFRWDSISTPLGSSRKRSLSESSVAVEKASVYDIFTDHGSDTSGERSNPSNHSLWAASGSIAKSTMTEYQKLEDVDVPISSPGPNLTTRSCLSPAETSQSQKGDLQNCLTSDSQCTSLSAGEEVAVGGINGSTVSNLVDAGTDSCTSGTEQYDGQGTGKKRRATGDVSCPEIPSSERNTKRRKIRGRKERTQVDQLLTISLREEELNNSLEGLDNNLLQARTALQAAYMEVQRLLVLKQQITMEMSTLRTQRIQLLQGLQGTFEPPSDITEERSPRVPSTPVMSPGNIFPFLVETPSYLTPPMPSANAILPAPVRVCSPQSFQSLPAAPVAPDSSAPVKREPVSPEGVEKMITTPPPSTQSVTTPETNSGVGHKSPVYPIITATMSLAELNRQFPSMIVDPSVDMHISKVTSPPPLSTQVNLKPELCSPDNKAILLDSCSSSMQDQNLPLSEVANNYPIGQPEEQQAESTLIMIETKSGKKKKKLRKKKTLRATHVPENSDTELDIHAYKPVRKCKNRRLSKETTVSTSTSPDQEHDATSQETEMNRDDNYSDSNVEVVEITNPHFEVVAIDSEDEKPDSPVKTDLGSSREGDFEANDEVTSTSELGTNYVDETLRCVASNRRASLRGSKNSSAEVSSEPGEDEEPTEGSFEGHQAAVNAIQIFGGLLYTCSADKTVRVYNLVTRQCVGVFEGHTSKVNCLLVTQTYGKTATLFTGSSDHTIRCYSIKSQEYLEQLELGERVLCLHVRWRILYAGLANGTVVTFSLKNNKQIDVFECHGPRAVSCLATAQEGSRRLLLVGSYDCTISVRDARNGLLLRTLEGHTKTVLCMKVVNDLVFSGSSDQSVHAHNIHTGELVRIYKGHNHAVTVVNILGKVMVTACLDKFVRVYELQSHDRLQVYGGHSDMIMCMAIHKSMIYTGCYDGSVQAVHLNLMQNYRCWWHGCSLIFGVAEHLKQHLLTDHTNPNFQTLKCRWKNCDAFFTARRGSKQDAVGHIERHAEEDSRVNT
ncbi:zinc finger protein 106 [Discoglossus pictus]